MHPTGNHNDRKASDEHRSRNVYSALLQVVQQSYGKLDKYSLQTGIFISFSFSRFVWVDGTVLEILNVTRNAGCVT